MAIYDHDIVESIYTTKDNPVQRQSFAYAKQSANGHYVVEAVGGRKNPNITPVMVLEFNSNKWNSMINSGLTLGEILYEADEGMKSALDGNITKRTELPRRNLLLMKPLLILRVLLGSIIVYHNPNRKATVLIKNFRKRFRKAVRAGY